MNQSSSDPGFLLHISQLLVLEWIIQESYIIKMLTELSHLGSMFFKKWKRSPYCRAITDFMPTIYHVSCLPLIYEEMALEMYTQSGRESRNAKKPLNCFQGCHENALNESFEMSPHLIGLG